MKPIAEARIVAASMKDRDAGRQGAALAPDNAAWPSGQSGLSMIIGVSLHSDF
jgi:hypothetical protein